jgi:hypothetical protein
MQYEQNFLRIRHAMYKYAGMYVLVPVGKVS